MQRSVQEQINASRLTTILSFDIQTIQDLTGLKEDHTFIIKELWDIPLSCKINIDGNYVYDVYLSSKLDNPRGRIYPQKGKYSYARNPCKLLRNYLLPDGCKSFDLVSAETQIIHKIAKKLEIETPTLFQYMHNPSAWRESNNVEKSQICTIINQEKHTEQFLNFLQDKPQLDALKTDINRVKDIVIHGKHRFMEST
jgi:hypothetical protein